MLPGAAPRSGVHENVVSAGEKARMEGSHGADVTKPPKKAVKRRFPSIESEKPIVPASVIVGGETTIHERTACALPATKALDTPLMPSMGDSQRIHIESP